VQLLENRGRSAFFTSEVIRLEMQIVLQNKGNFLHMPDKRTTRELKELGAGQPAPEEVAALYRLAFGKYGSQALWNRKPSGEPTIAQAVVVAELLRREGNVQSRSLAAQIEEACRAAL
jgi:hypothetical protein